VPFTKNVEWTIPGKFLYYATAMPRRTGGVPLIATTVDGRPIKLEGNPLHPASGGATDTFVQASILDLYDPTRSKRFVHKGKTSAVEDFEKFLAELHNTMLSDNGDGVAFLAEETNSPTRERLRGELEKKFPGMRWCIYETRVGQEANIAMQTAFGANARLSHERMHSRRKLTRERMIPVSALWLEIYNARQTLSTSNGSMGLQLI